MFQINGECMFIGEGKLGQGMKMADNLKAKGFKVTPVFLISAQPKQYRFTFEVSSGKESPSKLIL